MFSGCLKRSSTSRKAKLKTLLSLRALPKARRSNLLTLENGNAKCFSGSLKQFSNAQRLVVMRCSLDYFVFWRYRRLTLLILCKQRPK